MVTKTGATVWSLGGALQGSCSEGAALWKEVAAIWAQDLGDDGVHVESTRGIPYSGIQKYCG